MSQTQTPVSPDDPNPRKTRGPSPTLDDPLQPDILLNPGMASVPAKPTVTSDNSDLAAADGVGTLKRPREEDSLETGSLKDVPESKRRVKPTHDVIYRIVVPSRQIGKVIGRAGHRIQKVREDTQATIKIADAVSRQEERVIIISSKDSENGFSDAENALHQIVSLILKNDCSSTAETSKIGPEHIPANAVRLLIAGSQAGGLIGVSGQNIVNLRNTSGANITILPPTQLPPCASAHESDRVVQISGEVPAVLRAVVEIGCQLRGNAPKQVISISQPNNAGNYRRPHPYMDPSSADHVTLELMVPENLVGGLIGRFGANISRIRNESGANIKVYGGRGEQTQRQIHLAGSSQQIALAKQRVDEYIYAELMRQAGGQLQLTANQLQPNSIQQPLPIPDMSNTLYQNYVHAPGLYTTSSHEVGMMAALPPIYASSGMTTQPPAYYDHQSFPAPPL